MNLQEARSILELSPDADAAEAKKKYREFTKKYHPDINKDPGAEDKFKKINEAYQCVSTGKGTDKEDLSWQTSHQGFNPFGNHNMVPVEHVQLFTTISFKDSVLGCKRDLKFNRKVKCQECHGQGEVLLNNGCDKCNGRGSVSSQKGQILFKQTCPKCFGNVPRAPCKKCNTDGFLDAETSLNVTIPGGVQNSNILRLNGKGNYAGSFGPLEQYTDAHLHIQVTPEPGLTLEGSHVISNLEVSLLEALQGCQKTINTILGNKEIEIPARSRNKEEVIIPHLGVNRQGNHRVILDIKYPDDINKLIETLSSYNKEII
jgi:molecular chaperone DnaJ